MTVSRSDDKRPMLDLADRDVRPHENGARDGDRLRQVEKIDSLGLLARGIAHDFNNLLMAILGNADLARSEIPGDDATLLSFVEEIEKASLRAAQHCRRLMTFAGRGRFALAPVDLNRVVEDLRAELDELAGSHAIVGYDLDDDVPPVEADAVELRAALIELARNAVEASHGQSRIQVATGVAHNEARLAQAVGAAHDAEREYVYFEVSDDGLGMDEVTARRATDPFFSTKDAGRGLGLSNVFGIVRTHAGRLHLGSTVGRGTSVRCYLPAMHGSTTAHRADAFATLPRR